MSEQESNVCEICGGAKLAWYQSELNAALNNPGKEIYTRVLPEPFRICGGHPDPHPPHKYCPKCEVWKDLDGMHCAVCGTTLALRRLDEQTEPATKHDGKLDEHHNAYVKITEYPEIEIGSRGDEDARNTVYHAICISPKQALSLLDWLLQERGELARLAKEQGE